MSEPSVNELARAFMDNHSITGGRHIRPFVHSLAGEDTLSYGTLTVFFVEHRSPAVDAYLVTDFGLIYRCVLDQDQAKISHITVGRGHRPPTFDTNEPGGYQAQLEDGLLGLGVDPVSALALALTLSEDMAAFQRGLQAVEERADGAPFAYAMFPARRARAYSEWLEDSPMEVKGRLAAGGLVKPIEVLEHALGARHPLVLALR